MTGEQPVSLDELASLIGRRAHGRERLIAAVAGPPGAGKSTLSARLAAMLNGQGAERRAIVVPMDGFHYDNAVLEARGLAARKGAPETFDVSGLSVLLERLARPEEVAIPLFDRALDLARAGAAVATAEHSIVIIEGNYLLLDETPWEGLSSRFHLTVRVEASIAELERRLVRRWLDHGLDREAATKRALSNDIPNALRVIRGSRKADYLVRSDV